jgi:hypothetical protein
MKRMPKVHMTAAGFLRSKALTEDLPELAAIADQLDDYEEMKPIMHWYVTAYARQKAALEMIANQRDGRNADTLKEARVLAKEALRYAEDQ